MDCSSPGFPVHQQLPELAQTHVRRVGNAILNPMNSMKKQKDSTSVAFNLTQPSTVLTPKALLTFSDEFVLSPSLDSSPPEARSLF